MQGFLWLSVKTASKCTQTYHFLGGQKWFFFGRRAQPFHHTPPHRNLRHLAPPYWYRKYATAGIDVAAPALLIGLTLSRFLPVVWCCDSAKLAMHTIIGETDRLVDSSLKRKTKKFPLVICLLTDGIGYASRGKNSPRLI